MTDQVRPLIFERISKVMQEIRAVKKDQRNEQQRFLFRGIDGVLNGVQPSMAKNEVFVTQEIMSRERKEFASAKGTVGVHCLYQYRFRFWTVDGSYVDTFVDGEGMDYGDKAANKCGSIALKYALINTLLIPTEESDDPDRECHEVVAPTRTTSASGVVREVTMQYRPGTPPISSNIDTVQSSKVAQVDTPKPVQTVQPTQASAQPLERAFIGEKMVAAFKADFGIERKTLESFLMCKVSQCGDNEISRMRDCYGRLKAGDAPSIVFASSVTKDLF